MTPGKRYMTSDEIRPLAARSDLMGALLVAHAWAVIAGAVALFAIWPNPLTFVLSAMVIGSRQLGLAILMHDAAHRALFRTGWMNEVAGRWLCGYPILADMDAYRHYHLTHHRHTQTDKDPDLRLSAPFPTTRASLRRKFTRDLTGQTGIRQLYGQFVTWMTLAGDDDAVVTAKVQAFKAPGLGRPLMANAVLLALFWLAGLGWLYLALWIVPLLTWFQLVLRVRNIAEHALTERSDDPFRNVRTTRANWLARALVAPYWVNYHLEHHMIMHVPCYRLPAMHKLLLSKGLGPRMTQAGGYLDVLKQVSARSALRDVSPGATG